MVNTSRNNQITTLEKKLSFPNQLPDLTQAIEKVEKIPGAFTQDFKQMVEVLSVVRPMVKELQEEKKASDKAASKVITSLTQADKTFTEQNKLSKELNESVELLLADTKKLLGVNKQLKKENKELSSDLDWQKKLVKYLKIAFTVVVLGIIGIEAYQHHLISSNLILLEKKLGNIESQTKTNAVEIERALANQTTPTNSNIPSPKKRSKNSD